MATTKKIKKSESAAVGHPFPVVGIGASAGGLEAFLLLFAKMPTDTGMAFVLVQHLDPTHSSLSVEIIARSTKLKVEEVKNKTRIQPNHIYVIPPNHNMEIQDRILNLSAREEIPGKKMTIDFFLQSLAISEKNRAIGIILSGTGTDGTLGLSAIQAEGGFTYAQDPQSAKYSGMPESAIAAGVVDLIMRPEDLAKELAQVTSRPAITRQKKVKSANEIFSENEKYSPTSHALHKIFSLVKSKTKVDFADYKQTTIRRRIERRMTAQKAKSLHDYALFLAAHDEEVMTLYNDILINVTDFFRDPESFAALSKTAFPSLIKDRPAGLSIRLWIAGCSSGEEVYSIAILLLEFLAESKKQYPIQIFATDISDKVIQKARLGIYPNTIAQSVSKKRLDRFFDKVAGGYKIQKMIRDLCLFSKHDITSDPPFAKLDLISCRNVLIYFAKSLQKRVIPIFHYALRPGGFLWLGKSENPGEEFTKLFNITDKAHKIYSKSSISFLTNFHVQARSLSESAGTDEIKKGPLLLPAVIDFKKDADKLILSKFAPPSVIINANFEILQFRGRTTPFLEPSVGQPSLNLLKMARPELLTGLRSIIQSVRKENQPFGRKGLHFKAHDKTITVDIEALPLNPLAVEKDRMYLVFFNETHFLKNKKTTKKTKAKKIGSKKFQKEDDKRFKDLIAEISEVKDYQQALIEQYETTQGDLSSANEELQSTNEEFLSANEEIETAKEELQSTNEELVTVNDELQIRNTDLTLLSSDLNNVLSSIEIPVLIVGGDHCIRRFSPKAKEAFNLISSDIGRPISDIKSNFNLNLKALIAEVAENLNPRAIDIQDAKGLWLRIQIRPYTTVDNKVDGAIITLFDIDVLKQKEIKIKESLEYINSVANSVPLPLAVINFELQLKSANNSFYKYFQVSENKIGKNIFDFLEIQGCDIQSFHNLFSKTIKENKPFVDFEMDCEIAHLGTRKLLLSASKINWIGAKQESALASFVDITEQRQNEAERKVLLTREQEARAQADNANKSKDIFLATLSHELRTPLSAILTWAQLISQGKVSFEKAKQGAAIIEQSAKAQSKLIDDLLDISRFIAGKLTLELIPVDPAVVIRAAIETVRPIAEKKLIHIETEISNDSGLINADPIRLQQVIWNLFTNAIKFSPKNSTVHIQLKYLHEADQKTAQIKVCDSGKGIPPDFLPHIFNRFSQADSASTRVHGGLGLGLSIVQNLVKLQNGAVTAENIKNGSGAIFTVTFPLIVKAPITKSALPTLIPSAAIPPFDVSQNHSLVIQHKTIGQPNLEKLRILFVDDDEVARDALTLYLNLYGAEVMTASSAHEALEIFPKFKPNFLLSDISMPGGDGYSLMKQIRAFDKSHGKNIPALALTALATPKDVEQALIAGFQSHIAKPVEAIDLGRTILQIFEDRSS